MDGGRDLAASMELHEDLTAADLHQVQSATASQEFWLLYESQEESCLSGYMFFPLRMSMKSFMSGSWEVTGSTSSSSSLSQEKIDGGRDLASSIELQDDLTAADLHQVQSATASQEF